MRARRLDWEDQNIPWKVARNRVGCPECGARAGDSCRIINWNSPRRGEPLYHTVHISRLDRLHARQFDLF